MINAETIERLETEADRLRTRYYLKTTADLERIARDEYGVVSVIKTPLACDYSKLVRYEDKLYLFYHASFTPRETHALGHELGHIAAGHLNGRKPKLSVQEEEADYFSQRLNGVSPSQYWLYLSIDAGLSFKENILNGLYRKKRESERLRQMGLSHIFFNNFN